MTGPGPRTSAAPDVGGPMPPVDGRVFLENLASGPAETRALEVSGDLVRVDPPRAGGREIVLREGERLALAYDHGTVPCAARSVVAAGPAGAPGLWLRITLVERIQRRGAVRVPYVALVTVTPVREGAEPLTGMSEDVSAGGVLVRFETPPSADEAHTVSIDLGDGAPPVFPARIVRVQRDTRPTRPWRVAFAFGAIGRAAEDRLTRFVFQRQRELRSRERGDT